MKGRAKIKNKIKDKRIDGVLKLTLSETEQRLPEGRWTEIE